MLLEEVHEHQCLGADSKDAFALRKDHRNSLSFCDGSMSVLILK